MKIELEGTLIKMIPESDRDEKSDIDRIYQQTVCCDKKKSVH